jgi:acetyl-CoA carboxylase carboxyl transferase subunit alpha
MMKITAQDLLKFGIIDAVISEPVGGAHRMPKAAIAATGEAIAAGLEEFADMPAAELRESRMVKFMNIGRKP